MLVVLQTSLVLVLLFQAGENPADGRAMSQPKLPHYDWKACPFEGCGYGRWTARKPAIVYDNWSSGRRAVAKLAARERVTALTGVVITFKPGIIRMDRDLPDRGLKRGDTILTYTNRGEGFSEVWFNGKYYSEYDISFTKWPDGGGCNGASCAATYIDLGRVAWWAKVRLASGRIGWVDMDQAEFDGVDLLG